MRVLTRVGQEKGSHGAENGQKEKKYTENTKNIIENIVI
jgi:hypothetical protein